MTEFTTGTVVRLNSGGPLMTVEAVGPLRDDQKGVEVFCTWFDGLDQAHNGSYWALMLTVIVADDEA